MRSSSDFSFARPSVHAASDSGIFEASQPQQGQSSSAAADSMSDDLPMQLDFLPQSIGPYEIRGTVGEGSFSVVKLVYLAASHQYYACKVIERSRLRRSKLEERFETEIRIHQQLHHPSIVELVDIFKDEHYFYVIMEFCPGGELFQYIVDRSKLTEEAAKPIIMRVLEGLKYLHGISVIHRDLKPENLLLDQCGRVKLSDFGLSRFLDLKGMANTPCGSPCYASPECLSGKPYDGRKSDCWSIGVIFFAMVTGQLPWTKRNQTQLFQQIRKGDYTIPKSLSSLCRDFIANLMMVDPNKRLSAADALRHPFLEDVVDKDAILGSDGGWVVSLKKVDEFFDREQPFESVAMKMRRMESVQIFSFDDTLRVIVGKKNLLQIRKQKGGEEERTKVVPNKRRAAVRGSSGTRQTGLGLGKAPGKMLRP